MADQNPLEQHTLTGTSMAVRVIIDSRDKARPQSDTVSTVGVGTNIVEASWRALVDAIEYRLAMEDDQWRSGRAWERAGGVADGRAASVPSASEARHATSA